jgi:hypothetical protein
MFDFDMPPLDWRECDIPKQHKPWEKRHLTIPNDELKKQQVKVLHFLYTVKELRPSGFAHGFVPHRNTSSGVDRHDRNADIIICTDFSDFFDNFPLDAVRKALVDGGIGEILADKIMTLCTYKGHLPQGGPCSPYLTNLGMVDVDRMIASYAKKYGFTYSRYADDMSFSQNFEATGKKPRKSYDFLPKGVELITSTHLGLYLNHKKTHIIKMHGSTKPQITGIVIRQDGLGYNAPRNLRRNIRAAAFNLMMDIRGNGGRVNDEMFARWRKICGYVRYFDNIRSHGEGEAATADPCIKAEIWDELTDAFARAI